MTWIRAASLSLVVVAFAGAAPSALAGGNSLDGQVPPEISLTDGMNGATSATTLAALRGRVVCLKFWLPRCPICRGTLPAFQAIHDRYGRSGVVCLSVVISDVAGVQDYVRESGWTFPIGCDPSHAAADRYGVSHYPADYVVGVDGRVVASNGFPQRTIDEELRKFRLAEWGNVPDSLAAARDAVEDGNYGEALRIAEPVAAWAGASADTKKAVERLIEISKRRQDNRFARADAAAARGANADGRAELEQVIEAFRKTSLEARARARLDDFVASHLAGK